MAQPNVLLVSAIARSLPALPNAVLEERPIVPPAEVESLAAGCSYYLPHESEFGKKISRTNEYLRRSENQYSMSIPNAAVPSIVEGALIRGNTPATTLRFLKVGRKGNDYKEDFSNVLNQCLNDVEKKGYSCVGITVQPGTFKCHTILRLAFKKEDPANQIMYRFGKSKSIDRIMNPILASSEGFQATANKLALPNLNPITGQLQCVGFHRSPRIERPISLPRGATKKSSLCCIL